MKMSKSSSMIFQKAIVVLLLSLIGLSAWSQEKLILIGGGPNRPSAALKQFGDWCHQDKGRILLVTWASSIPEEVSTDLIEDFREQYSGNLDVSLRSPETPEEQTDFLDQLSKADGVFFSGGDQSKIMATFRRPGGKRIKDALTSAYHAGVVFGGTSAGTAIMSKFMIVGPAVQGIVPVAQGLGFLPENVIVDQHFSQRDRVGRLLKAQKQTHSSVAIGIDEDTALIVVNQKYTRVVGDHRVRIFTNENGLVQENAIQSGGSWWLPGSSSSSSSSSSECRLTHAN